MNIIVGSYEELILGYKLKQKDNGYSLSLFFTDHSHTGCVKTSALSSHGILATGSSDESIHLFNLRRNRDIGSLMQHSGAVTQIQFHGKSHMFSCSEDGSLCIWKVGKWECLKTLKGHKDAVTCLCVHPSGKLALSCGKDKTLRTWNLMTGKTAYITNLKEVIQIIEWSPDENTYITCNDRKVDVYTVKDQGVVYTFKVNFHISCAKFLKDSVLAISGDKGNVLFYNLKCKKNIHTIETKTNRVKGLCFAQDDDDKANTTDDAKNDDLYQCKLITASSDGTLNVYCLASSQDEIKSELIASENTKFRLICISANAEVKEIESLKKEDKHDFPESVESSKKVLISQEMGGSSDSDDDQEEEEDQQEQQEEEEDETSEQESEQEEEIKQVACKKKKMTYPKKKETLKEKKTNFKKLRKINRK